MSKINKLFLLFISEIIFFILLFIVLPTIFIWERSGISQTSFEKILPLDINHSYNQFFISDRDNLNSVSVLLKNPAIESRDMVYLEIQNSKQETLRDLSISGQGIGDPDWLHFKFPAINSKRGDIFFIKVSADSQKDNLLYVIGDKDTQNINFKTSYTSKDIKDSLKDNLSKQIENLQSRNISQIALYFLMIIIISILIIK